MLDTIFLQLYDMSKIASIVILIVLFVRLCLKRAPKVFSYALWAIVLFRLLCPVSLEAPISLIPQTEPTIQNYDLLNEPVTPLAAIDAAQQTVGDVLNGGIGIQHVKTTEFEEDGTRRIISTDWWNVWMLFIKHVWLFGMAALLVYSTVSLIRLRRRLIGAVLLRDNVYLADHIDSPFVMGALRPKIYLPSSLSEKERDYIILHEQHHIRRGDHIVKLLSFAALCLHSFNPLVWVAFTLSGKDMEMSCDEAVLRKLGEEIRVDYTASLIRLATGRRMIAGTPLAFGEGNTMGRVKNIARWKKPVVWVIVIAVVVCVVLAVCLITNPMNRETMLLGAEYRIAEELYRADGRITYEWKYEKSYLCIGADFSLWSRAEATEWECIGIMEPYVLDNEKLDEMAAVKDAWIGHRPGEITDAYILRMGGGLYTFVCCTKRGEVLHGVGTEENGLWFLHHLESVFGKDTTTGDFLDRSLAASVGGDIDSFFTWSHAGIPGYIIIGFESDDSPYNDGWQVPSPQKTDMGFAVFYHNKDESGYRLLQCHVYEDAALAENGIYLCPDPAMLDLNGEMKPDMTYDIVLVNNEAVDTITRHYSYTNGSERTISTPPISRKYMAVFSWDYYDKERGTSVQSVYDEQGELICQNRLVHHGMTTTAMVPTSANVRGAFDRYLFVPSGSVNYRYERIDDDPATVTKGELIVGFTEEAEPKDVLWRIYAVKEYPYRSVVLAADGDYFQLYRYSPPKAVDPALLEQAKEDGKIVLEDGYATSGQAVWNTFYKMSSEGKSVSAEIVHYYTLENGNYDETYYEVYKEDYPAMYTFDLTYDGDTYILTWNEYGAEHVRKYKYLRKFEDTLMTQRSSVPPQKVSRYVLTNNNTASWDDLISGAYSSQLGDYIDFYTIYSEKN